jgi:hypothetical protein
METSGAKIFGRAWQGGDPVFGLIPGKPLSPGETGKKFLPFTP